MGRVLFHIDINAFFASCEEIKNPRLRGLPIAVGSARKRCVLSTANYAARKCGVHSAMPVYEALAVCPDLEIVASDYPYYQKKSRDFFSYLYEYTPLIEPASIDECYMDVTDVIRFYARPLDLAFQIQNGIYEKTGLYVSIGVAPTKFLAKMASDMKKPKGITVLRISEIERKLWPLPVETIVGIGKKTVPILKKHGIETIGDFASPGNENTVLHLLGRNGYSMIQKTRGISTSRLDYSHTQKSISVSRTYEYDLYSMDEVLQHAQALTNELSVKMKEENQKGRLVSLTLRDTEFQNIVRSHTLQNYTDDPIILFETVRSLAEENFESIGYRHIAVHVGSIKAAKEIVEQPTIFEIPKDTTTAILKQLNQKIDGIHLFKASELLEDREE